MKLDSEKVGIMCESGEHISEFSYDHDMMYIHIYLAKETFFKRIWLGIKYIFGYKCKFGNYDAVLLTDEQVIQLQRLIHEYSFDKKHYIDSKKPIQQRKPRVEYDNL